MGDTLEQPPDLRAVLARIDRDLEESAQLRAENRRFIAAHDKLIAEEARLRSAARNLNLDRWIAPWLAITGLIGGLITVGDAIWRLWH